VAPAPRARVAPRVAPRQAYRPAVRALPVRMFRSAPACVT
jgi:hypothetical protein